MLLRDAGELLLSNRALDDGALQRDLGLTLAARAAVCTAAVLRVAREAPPQRISVAELSAWPCNARLTRKTSKRYR